MLKSSYDVRLPPFDLVIFDTPVPEDYYLRQLKALIDFSPQRDLVLFSRFKMPRLPTARQAPQARKSQWPQSQQERFSSAVQSCQRMSDD
jgi:hypothetical protein